MKTVQYIHTEKLLKQDKGLDLSKHHYVRGRGTTMYSTVQKGPPHPSIFSD